MEPLDSKCPQCSGTGRAQTGNASVDVLEHDVAQLKWQIADLTEAYGLDLRHQMAISGEAQARDKVGKLQGELSQTLSQLEAARDEAGDQEVVCRHCGGKGLVLTEAGEQLARFIYRWIHPNR